MTSAPESATKGAEAGSRRQEFSRLGVNALTESFPAVGSPWFLERILRNRLVTTTIRLSQESG
jgi:hypothetical protein